MQALAQAVVSAVTDLKHRPRYAMGEAALRIDGPGGMWKVKMHQNGQRVWTLSVIHPHRGPSHPLYSLKSVLTAMHDDFGVDTAQLVTVYTDAGAGAGANDGAVLLDMDEEVSVGEDVVMESPLRTLAAVVIQSAVRVRNAVRAMRARAVLRAQIRDLEHRLVMQETTLQTGLPAVKNTLAAQHDLRTAYPECMLLLPMTRLSEPFYTSAASPVSHLMRLMYNVIMTTREEYSMNAQNLITSIAGTARYETKHEFKCSRAIQKTFHYPILIGSVPLLPPGLYKTPRRLGDGASMYVRCSDIGTISQEHYALLCLRFRGAWADHVRVIAQARDLRAYDFFSDARTTTYCGSVVVSKYIARQKGAVLPVLSIESIVVPQSQTGKGSRIYDFCENLLFSDAPRATKGIIFAQCLANSFWELRLDASAMAQCLVFQMYMLYDSYEFEDKCTMRSRVIERDDGIMASPVKESLDAE